MDFQDFQQSTNSTNVYSEAIDELLEPIYKAINEPSDYYKDYKHALDRLDELKIILNIGYALVGYANEVGEIAGKFKKTLRGDHDLSQFIGMSFDEQGDALYYASELAAQTGYKLDDIAKGNNRKLTDRRKRGVIKGSGDHR